MNVLSCFDGMSCGQIALNRIGIKPKKYYASEIDKHAIKVTQTNFPETIQVGDIQDVDPELLGHIDLIIGGSPCQGFSFAGKQLAFDDPRSVLFFNFVELLEQLRLKNPNIKFLLENVKMKKEYLAVISKMLGVEPVCINSSLVSAQNRVRYYWTNISELSQPRDLDICLADIIESGVVDRKKSYCIDANYFKGGNLKSYFEKRRRQLVFRSADILDADTDVKCGAIRGRYIVGGKQQDHKIKPARLTEQRIEIRKDDKTNAPTTVQKDNIIITGEKYRKLTPTECERLQTVPDNYTNHVSNTQRYKMLGNGWTVDVIAHIFEGLKA
ncbi:MAG: DNA cytosine methyltransferase [Planctomycetaceae bacterium]|nr:DNA cytosine methyltransferase [Planctomycetaceae bacterium]